MHMYGPVWTQKLFQRDRHSLMHKIIYFISVFQMRSAYWGYIQYIAISGADKHAGKKQPDGSSISKGIYGQVEYHDCRQVLRLHDLAAV
ncbi:hypothetical protein LH22_12140 [Pantoea rwandensis]|uniref:Uncharacterized protein n=1 Tax=Pantoea rwandensis TaxID=1076550 RepID=A0ABM5RJL5_9GAMM|nr:hypothetical protein LH22_12140 [Pantoea rwandensis]